ncbi:MAG TPA: exodeoxyribonuclease III [Polyangiaceae bacterium]|nr:exodeoxyribonuclease III [Polyangiaceae bacterium]
MSRFRIGMRAAPQGLAPSPPEGYPLAVRIASFNVNSIRAREQAVLDWVRGALPDVLCLQETKVEDDDFPTDEFLRLGYAVAMAGQPAYNGVAIAARGKIQDVCIGLEGDPPGADRRCIAATVDGVRVYSVYVPNGKVVGSPSFAEKLAFLERLRRTLDERESPDRELIVCGDFNVAADERDVYDPEAYRGQLHFHPDEHRALKTVLDFGLVDVFRHFHSESGAYSWWDYRALAFAKNQGLRIDYAFVTRPLLARATGAFIDVAPRRLEKPSDHAPVVVDLA